MNGQGEMLGRPGNVPVASPRTDGAAGVRRAPRTRGTAPSAVGLFDVITVHCFACRRVVTDATPDGAHNVMEQHYTDEHAALIALIASEVAR